MAQILQQNADENQNRNMDRFQCGICYDSFTRNKRAPISLNCGHTFCRQCVSRLYHYDDTMRYTSKMALICGACRAMTYSTHRRLKRNMMLLEFLEEKKVLADTDDEEEVENGPQINARTDGPEQNAINQEQGHDDTMDVIQFGPFGEYGIRLARAQEMLDELRRISTSRMPNFTRELEHLRRELTRFELEANTLNTHFTEKLRRIDNILTKLSESLLNADQQPTSSRGSRPRRPRNSFPPRTGEYRRPWMHGFQPNRQRAAEFEGLWNPDSEYYDPSGGWGVLPDDSSSLDLQESPDGWTSVTNGWDNVLDDLFHTSSTHRVDDWRRDDDYFVNNVTDDDEFAAIGDTNERIFLTLQNREWGRDTPVRSVGVNISDFNTNFGGWDEVFAAIAVQNENNNRRPSHIGQSQDVRQVSDQIQENRNRNGQSRRPPPRGNQQNRHGRNQSRFPPPQIDQQNRDQGAQHEREQQSPPPVVAQQDRDQRGQSRRPPRGADQQNRGRSGQQQRPPPAVALQDRDQRGQSRRPPPVVAQQDRDQRRQQQSPPPVVALQDRDQRGQSRRPPAVAQQNRDQRGQQQRPPPGFDHQNCDRGAQHEREQHCQLPEGDQQNRDLRAQPRRQPRGVVQQNRGRSEQQQRPPAEVEQPNGDRSGQREREQQRPPPAVALQDRDQRGQSRFPPPRTDRQNHDRSGQQQRQPPGGEQQNEERRNQPRRSSPGVVQQNRDQQNRNRNGQQQLPAPPSEVSQQNRDRSGQRERSSPEVAQQNRDQREQQQRPPPGFDQPNPTRREQQQGPPPGFDQQNRDQRGQQRAPRTNYLERISSTNRYGFPQHRTYEGRNSRHSTNRYGFPQNRVYESRNSHHSNNCYPRSRTYVGTQPTWERVPSSFRTGDVPSFNGDNE